MPMAVDTWNHPEHHSSRGTLVKNLLLAIPVYNEAEYVERVIAAVGRHCANILVIDDGSTDATPALLKKQPSIQIITHPENRGYGKSLADAFAFAQCRGFEWLITMDCDEQHEPASIPIFIEAINEDDADIISGTRYPKGRDVDVSVPPDRRRINQHITDLLNRGLGLTLTDAFCGFKAYRVASLASLSLSVPGYAMPMQFWVQAARAALRIRELPVGLIYNDPTRHFGGLLDNPDERLKHYLSVYENELARPHSGIEAVVPPASCHIQRRADCQPCR